MRNKDIHADAGRPAARIAVGRTPAAGDLESRMPVYEYECIEDGTVIELIRPMSKADEPVEDPDAKGRTFKRKHSVFSAGGAGAAVGGGGAGCCPCGKGAGMCSRPGA
jgi:hypothetical protein